MAHGTGDGPAVRAVKEVVGPSTSAGVTATATAPLAVGGAACTRRTTVTGMHVETAGGDIEDVAKGPKQRVPARAHIPRYRATTEGGQPSVSMGAVASGVASAATTATVAEPRGPSVTGIATVTGVDGALDPLGLHEPTREIKACIPAPGDRTGDIASAGEAPAPSTLARQGGRLTIGCVAAVTAHYGDTRVLDGEQRVPLVDLQAKEGLATGELVVLQVLEGQGFGGREPGARPDIDGGALYPDSAHRRHVHDRVGTLAGPDVVRPVGTPDCHDRLVADDEPVAHAEDAYPVGPGVVLYGDAAGPHFEDGPGPKLDAPRLQVSAVGDDEAATRVHEDGAPDLMVLYEVRAGDRKPLVRVRVRRDRRDGNIFEQNLDG